MTPLAGPRHPARLYDRETSDDLWLLRFCFWCQRAAASSMRRDGSRGEPRAVVRVGSGHWAEQPAAG